MSITRSPPARKISIRIHPEPVANTRKKAKARIAASRNARSQVLLQAEASKPAASAQHIALAFTKTDSAASAQLTPPSRNGIVNTGSTASPRVTRPQPVRQPFGHDNVRPLQGRQEQQPQSPFAPLPADAIRRQHRHQQPNAPKSAQWSAPNNWRPKRGLESLLQAKQQARQQQHRHPQHPQICT